MKLILLVHLLALTGCVGGMGANVVSQAVQAEASSVATESPMSFRASSPTIAGGSSRPAERAQKAASFYSR